jgi:hypothetical protein
MHAGTAIIRAVRKIVKQQLSGLPACGFISGVRGWRPINLAIGGGFSKLSDRFLN